MDRLHLIRLIATVLTQQNVYLSKMLAYAPTALYKHNEAGGSVIVDYSGNGIDGAYYEPDPGAYGGDTFLDGSPAYYSSFDSVGSAYADGLVLGDNPFEWTGSFMEWIKPSSTITDPDELWLSVDYYQWVVGDTDRCEIKLYRISATEMQFVVNRGVEKTHNFTYTPDEWMHIAVTTNDTETKLYVNGELAATLTGYGTNNFALDWDYSFYNFVYATTGGLSYCGYWKDVILTAEQIADLANVPGVNEEFSPVNSGVPTLSTSTPVIGTPITITPGTWIYADSLTYQWQRYVGSWGDISGATNSSYTPVDADFGYALRVVETGTNANGSGSVNSAGTTNLTREAVAQSYGPWLVTNPDLDNWFGGAPANWTKANDNGTTATITETAPDGTAGTGAATFSNTGSAIFVNLTQDIGLAANDWMESELDMTAFTGGRLDVSASGSAAIIDSNTVSNRSQLERSASGPNITMQVGGSLPRLFTVSRINSRKLIPNVELIAPSENMRITALFTTPGSPKRGYRVLLPIRISSFSSGNYLLALYEYTTQWNINFYTVAGHARGAAVASASNIGAIDGMRVNCNGNSVTMETLSGSTWTQRGITMTIATYNTAKGVNLLAGSAFTLGNLYYEPAV